MRHCHKKELKSPFGKAAEDCDWQLVVGPRERHCPMCTQYLSKLEGIKQDLANIKIDLIASQGMSLEF
jgi:predicted dithiol-disulfide oxidoreductase (DUF899 family)